MRITILLLLVITDALKIAPALEKNQSITDQNQSVTDKLDSSSNCLFPWVGWGCRHGRRRKSTPASAPAPACVNQNDAHDQSGDNTIEPCTCSGTEETMTCHEPAINCNMAGQCGPSGAGLRYHGLFQNGGHEYWIHCFSASASRNTNLATCEADSGGTTATMILHVSTEQGWNTQGNDNLCQQGFLGTENAEPIIWYQHEENTRVDLTIVQSNGRGCDLQDSTCAATSPLLSEFESNNECTVTRLDEIAITGGGCRSMSDEQYGDISSAVCRVKFPTCADGTNAAFPCQCGTAVCETADSVCTAASNTCPVPIQACPAWGRQGWTSCTCGSYTCLKSRSHYGCYNNAYCRYAPTPSRWDD